jgi:AcrR family transcriptional regulator
MNMPISATNKPVDTRTKILDAAESLFVERGYSATSLRAIADRAGVNLAATNYHFGSKSGLLAEVFHRHISPVNDQRMANLNQLEMDGQQPTVRAILEAFFTPFVRGNLYATAPAVIGWIYSEPEAVSRPIFEQEFTAVSARFQNALATVLPQLEQDELKWRFHFMIGSMLHLLKLNAPLGIESSRSSFEDGLERLINYSIAGLEQRDTGERDA